MLGLRCCERAVLWSEWRPLFVAVSRLLTAVAFLVAKHGLYSTAASVVVAPEL